MYREYQLIFVRLAIVGLGTVISVLFVGLLPIDGRISFSGAAPEFFW